jgi:hypothetical protein
MQNPDQPGGWRTILAGLEAAEHDGLSIRGQVLPRPTGGLMGLDLTLHPFSLNPSYGPIADLPLAEKVAALRDPELRRRLLAEAPVDPHPFFTYVVSEHEQLFVLGDPPGYHPAPEDSIAARARRAGRGARSGRSRRATMARFCFGSAVSQAISVVLFGAPMDSSEGQGTWAAAHVFSCGAQVFRARFGEASGFEGGRNDRRHS